MKNPFDKLIRNCKMNAIFQKEDGSWDIESGNGRRRLQGYGWHGVHKGDGTRKWDPPKLLITAKDLEKIWIDQGGRCFWFDVPLDLGLLFDNHPDWVPRHPLAPSVDRKSDDGDYTMDNIVICCRFANWGRSVYPFDKTKQLISMLKGTSKTETPLEKFLGHDNKGD